MNARSSAIVTIRPSRGWVSLRLWELWSYRELLGFLIWRDVKVRYKQTALGAAWAVIQPFFTMVVFSVFFGRLAGLPSDGVPYPLFTFAALLPWQLFAFSLNESSNSLVTHQRLISKVYFPRLIIPLSAVGVGLVDFCVSFSILLVMMAYYGVGVTAAVWTVPIWALIAVLSALSVGLWLSALNVQYRDIRYMLPFLVQVWMFASPVAYSSSLVPEKWRALYALNPMVGVIDGFRWALFGVTDPPGVTALVSIATLSTILISGLIYFRRTERTLADLI